MKQIEMKKKKILIKIEIHVSVQLLKGKVKNIINII